ncbi:MAG: ABC transporter substrate-binding protein [Clostridia bacterium]|nr:ABC transporter substrate-binding protein [Clostridia bacterium]
MKIKRLLSAVLITALVLTTMTLVSCSSKKDKYTVGVIQLITHDALDAATEGFIKALEDKLGKDNVEIDVQNAAGSPDTCATIAKSFVTKKVDLIMANATSALQAAYNATATIPILGTSVTEYGVALGIENFSGTVGENVSGTSDLADLAKQAQMIIDLVPNAQKVGMLYCSAEANSDYQVKKVSEYLKKKGLTCVNYEFSDSNDVTSVTQKAASECDAIYIPTDNTAASCAETIYGAMGENKKPIIAGESGICAGCGIATLSISYYDLGYKTGEMAASILKKEAEIEKMPIAYAPQETKKYNKAICNDLGIDTKALEDAGYTALD